MTRPFWLSATVFAVLGIGATLTFNPTPRLIWNASASVPIGFYLVHPPGALQLHELLVIAPPEPLAGYLAARHYLARGVPLLKHVAALPGQTVCRTGRTVAVDGITAGEALDRDHVGRPLPVWQGCRTIEPGEVFLMNAAPASLDSRYFGPLSTTTIVGRAEPIWIKGSR